MTEVYAVYRYNELMGLFKTKSKAIETYDLLCKNYTLAIDPPFRVETIILDELR